MMEISYILLGVGDLGRYIYQFLLYYTLKNLKTVEQEESLFTHGKVNIFVLFQFLTDRMRLRRVRESNLLYSAY